MAEQELLLLTLVSLLAIGGMVYSQGASGAFGVPIDVDPAWYVAGAEVGQTCIAKDLPNAADWNKCCSYDCGAYCETLGNPEDCLQHCKWSCREELKKEFSLYYTK
ncbi:MAG: hypothetical protein ACE5FT_04210 [Candidatus Nanoarchaeia archaeon]